MSNKGKPPKIDFKWFTSDPHFRHANIIELAKRPFNYADDMDETMIRNWNACVMPGDKILCLGDFTLSRDRVQCDKIMQRLNGDKYLIPGNHDHWLVHDQLRAYWTILPPLFEFEIPHAKDGHNQYVVASHFPLLTWNRAHRGSWMLHGHSHGNLELQNINTTRVDVGVDPAGRQLGEYRPFSWSEICSIMDKKAYKVVDHHEQKGDM